jgi:hypothetical protein
MPATEAPTTTTVEVAPRVKSATESGYPLSRVMKVEYIVVTAGITHRGRRLRGVPVTRVQDRVVGDPGQPGGEGLVHGRRVTSWEIGTATPFEKKGISRNQPVVH